MSPEDLLKWAEKVRLAVMGEEITKIMLEMPELPPQPRRPDCWPRRPDCWPHPLRFSDCHGFEPPPIDCGCPSYGICMNTACPRAVRITTSLNQIRPIQSPHSLYDHA